VNDLRVLVVGDDAPFALAVRDVIAAELPQATCDCVDVAVLRAKAVATAVAVDARENPPAAVALAARQRAMGFAGAIVLICIGDERAIADASRYGYALVAPEEMAAQLVPQLTAQLLRVESPHAPLVARARQLVAAGEIAAKLQHSLNNALMGLLAEVQLMQLEELRDDHAAALERMLGLCRRMIELIRSLDGLSDRKQTSS
jgi:signal transduction histidine kinase